MSVRDLVAEPPWTVQLPRVSTVTPECPLRGLSRYRGIPVAATCYAGQIGTDMGRALELGLRRRCSLCGCGLGRVVYNVQTQETGSPWKMWQYGPGVAIGAPPGPMHASCAAYLALMCPFLRYERGWHRFNTEHTDGSTRRGAGAIVGFASYGYAPKGTGTFNPRNNFCRWAWAYFDPAERIGLPHNAAHVVGPIYDAVIAADARHVNTASRLYWLDDDTAPTRSRMAEMVSLVCSAASSVTIGAHTYWPVP